MFFSDSSINLAPIESPCRGVVTRPPEIAHSDAITERVIGVVVTHLLEPRCGELLFGDFSTRIEDVVAERVGVEFAKLEKPAFKLKPARRGIIGTRGGVGVVLLRCVVAISWTRGFATRLVARASCWIYPRSSASRQRKHRRQYDRGCSGSYIHQRDPQSPRGAHETRGMQ